MRKDQEVFWLEFVSHINLFTVDLLYVNVVTTYIGLNIYIALFTVFFHLCDYQTLAKAKNQNHLS